MESVVVTWSREEEKAFENSIAMHCVEEEEEVTNDQWMKMASMVPTKTIEEIKKHYQMLVEDVKAIESGHVPLPRYHQRKGTIVVDETTSNSPVNKDSHSSGGSSEKKPTIGVSNGGGGGGRSSGSRAEQERRKGIPWTEEEHRFLLFTFFNKNLNLLTILAIFSFLLLLLLLCVT